MAFELAIYKYPIHVGTLGVITLPKGARILSAICQLHDLVLYARVDTALGDAHKEAHSILVLATGQVNHYEDGRLEFIDTVQMPGGLVFHVFELDRPTGPPIARMTAEGGS